MIYVLEADWFRRQKNGRHICYEIGRHLDMRRLVGGLFTDRIESPGGQLGEIGGPALGPTKGHLMPRYFTHLYSSEMLRDERGEDFAGPVEALAAARASAGELIAERITEGKIVDLGHRLEVMDEDGELVLTLTFAELFNGAGSGAPDSPS